AARRGGGDRRGLPAWGNPWFPHEPPPLCGRFLRLPSAAGSAVPAARRKDLHWRDVRGLNPEQLAAVEATGEVFVSAGAGTGKTSVLVERFVRAVCDGGLDVDSVLVITYTRKAAGELRARIRAALTARGRHDLARALDGAWISTIHGFCARLLKAHPF